MTLAAPIRKRTWNVDPKNPESIKQLANDIGEMARDLNQYLARFPPMQVLEFPTQYAEPMYVAYDHNPKGIVCMRVRPVTSLESVTLAGGTVYWCWEGGRSRARIDSIDGMTPGTNTTYLFTFLVVG